MAGYVFLSETQNVYAGANWQTLSTAIMANLRKLEVHLNSDPATMGEFAILTTLHAHGVPNRVFSWVTDQAINLITKIDAVRVGMGFGAFQWPADFSTHILDQTRLYSAADINRIARAVGCQFERASTENPFNPGEILAPNGHHYIIQDAAYEGEEYWTKETWYNYAQGIDGFLSLGSVRTPEAVYRPDLSNDRKASQNIRNFSQIANFLNWPGKGGGQWQGSATFEDMKCYYYAYFQQTHFDEKDSAVQDIVYASRHPDYRRQSSPVHQMAIGKMPDPSISYKEFLGLETPVTQISHVEEWDFGVNNFIDNPGFIGGMFYFFDTDNGSQVTDLVNDPQLYVAAIATQVKSKTWDILGNIQGYPRANGLNKYIYQKNTVEKDVAFPQIDLLSYEDEGVDSTRIVYATTSTNGLFKSVSNSLPSGSRVKIGLMARKTWEESSGANVRPEPSDVKTNTLNSLFFDPNDFPSWDTTINGEIIKRKVAYAEWSCTIPFVWAASRR